MKERHSFQSSIGALFHMIIFEVSGKLLLRRRRDIHCKVVVDCGNNGIDKLEKDKEVQFDRRRVILFGLSTAGTVFD